MQTTIHIVLISQINTKKNVDFPGIYEKSKKNHKKRLNEQKTTGCKNIIFYESQQS